jgi:Flp pilus assembly protein TadB
MSKQRARSRELRAAETARRLEQEQARLARESARRRRRSILHTQWRHTRLWRRLSPHTKDEWAGLVTLIIAVIVLIYLFTGSLTAVLLVVLIAVIGLPALAVLVHGDKTR